MPRKLTQEEFVERATQVHGGKYDYSKVEYVNNYTKVCIICPIHGEFWQQAGGHLNGQECFECSRIHRKKKVYGVGVNDYEKPIVVNGQHIPSYDFWKSILFRCYSKSFLSRSPTYEGCSICEEWKYYSNFKRWYDEHYVEGYHLDKDILVQGNKVYGPQTTCFVPQEINKLILTRGRQRGPYKAGVYFSKGKFVAQYQAKGKHISLGAFSSEDEACKAYQRAKKIHIANVATEFYNEGKITKEVRDALYRWEIKEY